MAAQKTGPQAPMSDTRHLSKLKADERSITRSAPPQEADGLHTDVVMLQKADVWMSQFKTRLNMGIIALVVIWGSVSYYKSTEIRLEARTTPERIVADGSHVDAPELIQAIEGESIPKDTPVEVEAVKTEAVKTEEAVSSVPVKAAKAAPPKAVKKTVAQKTVKNKGTLSKSSSRQQKKLKKSLAAKPAS